jgi:hypothetical protein
MFDSEYKTQTLQDWYAAQRKQLRYKRFTDRERGPFLYSPRQVWHSMWWIYHKGDVATYSPIHKERCL